MTDQKQVTPGLDQQMDELLSRSFEPGHPLPEDFESKVMAAIEVRQRRADSSRAVLFIMLAYWAAASLVGGLSLWGAIPAAGGNGHAAAILATLVFLVAGCLFLVRQSGFRLSEVFLRTITH